MEDEAFDAWVLTLRIRGDEADLPPGREYRWKVRETGEHWRKQPEEESEEW